MMTQIYKILSSQELWRPETSKFRRDLRQLRDLMVNVSRTQQDVIKRKTALQTAVTPVHAHLIW